MKKNVNKNENKVTEEKSENIKVDSKIKKEEKG